MLDRLIELAFEVHAEKRKTTFGFQSNVLSGTTLTLGGKGGVKK